MTSRGRCLRVPPAALLMVLAVSPWCARGEGGAASSGPDKYGPDCLRSGCHDTLKKSERVHGPVGIGACDTCHAPTGEGHKFKLTRADQSLCTFCHLSVADKKVVHDPVRSKPCTSCHDPHGSKTKFLLGKPTVQEVCADCHTIPLERFVHGPLAVGECLACHEPHQSEFKGLLREPGSRQCFACHSDTAKLVEKMGHVHEPVGRDCTKCHAPHTSSHKGLLVKPGVDLCLECHDDIRKSISELPVVHGAVKEFERCGACHSTHGAEYPYLLRDRPMTLCMHCHSKEVTAPDGKKIPDLQVVLEGSTSKHGPIREGDCIACHNAHASVNYRLLKETFPQEFYEGFDLKNYALCFQCHQSTLVLDRKTTTLTGFRDGDLNLHYLHVHKEVKGRTCRACHEVHASSHPKHIRTSVPFGPMRWPLPLNFKKTPTGGECAPGCHLPKSYDNGGAPADPRETKGPGSKEAEGP